ncbi:hypothetical protein [Paenibacillus wulumuqiensis]|uniref:hypothetical protein n=1 Tax=Paenibacillus wulumuqiensis TaxID=1567107 RepID=UPI000696A488|nr:hypothetical protein [Paenibacillus wulumuqiensis]
MSTFTAFLGLAAFIAILVFLVLAVLSIIKKTGKAKRNFLYSAASFVLMIIMVIVSPDTPAAQKAPAAETAQPAVAAVPETKEKEVTAAAVPPTEQPAAADQQAQIDADKQKAQAAEQARIEAEAKKKADAAAKEAADKKAAEAAQKAAAAAKAKAAKEAAAKAIPGTIGMTPNQFRTAFNKSSAEVGMDLNLPQPTIESGPAQNTFQYMLSDNIAMTGTINKADGSVREIMLLGQTAGSYEESTNYLLIMGLIMKTVDPSATKEDNAAKMRKLGLMDDNLELANLDKKVIINDLRYSISYLEEIGLMFYVNDPDDK